MPRVVEVSGTNGRCWNWYQPETYKANKAKWGGENSKRLGWQADSIKISDVEEKKLGRRQEGQAVPRTVSHCHLSDRVK